MKKFFLLTAFVILFAPAGVLAGVLIEPLAGYNIKTKFDDDDSGKGTSYGGRLGYQNMGFQIGLDYLKSTLKLDDLDSDVGVSDIGAFVGYKFPFFIRVYGGYIFSSTTDKIDSVDPDEGGIDNLTFKKGTGTKVGLSFYALSFLAINFEMRNVTYKEVDVFDSASNTTLKGMDIDLKSKAYMISVSIPLSL